MKIKKNEFPNEDYYILTKNAEKNKTRKIRKRNSIFRNCNGILFERFWKSE